MEPPDGHRDRSFPKRDIEPIERSDHKGRARSPSRSRPPPLPPEITPLAKQPAASPQPLSAWTAKKTTDVKEKRDDLAKKLDPELLGLLTDYIKGNYNHYLPEADAKDSEKGWGSWAWGKMLGGARQLVPLDGIELTALNMFANLIEGYERDMREPFPREDSLLALVNYVFLKGQDESFIDFRNKYIEFDRIINENRKIVHTAPDNQWQAIKDANIKIAQTLQLQDKLFDDLRDNMLKIAFPNGSEDISVLPRGLNWPAYSALKRWVIPGLVRKLEPFIKSTAIAGAQAAQLQEMENHMRGAYGQEILDLAKIVGKRGRQILTEELLASNQAESLIQQKLDPFIKGSGVQQKIYTLLKDLGAGKGKEFNKLRDMLIDRSYPIVLQLFDVLLKDKPADVKPLTHILSKILQIRAEIQKDRQEYLKLIKGLTPAQIKEAIDNVGKEKAVIGSYGPTDRTPPETRTEELTAFLNLKIDGIVDSLGLSRAELSAITSDFAGAYVHDMVTGILANAVVEYYTAAYTPYTFSRPIVGYDSVRNIMEKIMGGKVFSKVDELLRNQADEDALNEDLQPGQRTPIDPEKEKKRVGATLAGLVNQGLKEGEGVTNEFFIDSLSQLLKQPAYRELKEALKLFGGEYITALLANLAVSNPNNPPGDVPIAILPGALDHLIHILKTEIAEPADLEGLLLRWKKMPESSEAEKMAKEEYKTKEIMPLFVTISQKVLEATKMKEDRFLPLPQIVKARLMPALEQGILPELLFDFAQGLALTDRLTRPELERWYLLENPEGLDVLGNDLVALSLQKLKTTLADNAMTIAHSLNESLAQKELTAKQETELSDAIQSVIPAIPDALLADLLPKLTQQILHKLAASYKGAYRGDATTAAFLQLRLRFAEANIDPKIYSRILAFHQRNPTIGRIEAQLGELRAQIQNPPSDKRREQIQSEIDALEVQLKNQGTPEQQKARRQELRQLLLEFRPLAIALLKDIGIESPADLPLASVAQEATYLTLVDSVLPDQLMRVYTDYLQFGQKEYPQPGIPGVRHTHKKNLDRLFNAPLGQHSVVVNALSAYANLATHYADNWVVAHMDELSTTVRAGLRPQGKTAPRAKPPVAGQTMIAGAPGGIPRIVGSVQPLRSEFLFPALRKEIKAALFDIVDNFLVNIEKGRNEREFGNLILAEVQVLTQHLQALNAVTRGTNKFLHEAKTSELVAELEKTKGLRHRDFPASGKFKAIEFNEDKMKTMDPRSPEYQDLNAANQGLRTEMQRNLEQNFYRQLTLWVLRMAGKQGPQDLSVAPMLRQMLWDLLLNEIGPSALRSTFETMGSQEMMNKLLATIAEKLNQSIQEMIEPAQVLAPQPVPPRTYPEVVGGTVIITAFLEQLGDAVPGTWTQVMLGGATTRIGEVVKGPIRSSIGGIVEQSLREILTTWSLRSLAEMSLTVPTLEDTLPVTRTQLDAAEEKKRKDNEAAIAAYKDNVQRMPAQIERLLTAKNWFGAQAFRFIQSSLQSSFDRTSEPLRQTIIGVPAHANLWFNMLETFMRYYPAPVVAPPPAPPGAPKGPVQQEP